jgi:hypothetical protein
MKNKHLVLLFVGVLALGGVVRWWPWRGPSDFRARLLPFDVANTTVCINLRAPEGGLTELVRTDDGWLATRDEASVLVSDSAVTPLLQVLAQLESVHVLHTERPDTLRVGVDPGWTVQVLSSDSRVGLTTLYLGDQHNRNDQPHTWLSVNQLNDLYAVPGDLRAALRFDFESFTQRAPFAGVLWVRFQKGIEVLTSADTSLLRATSDTTWVVEERPDSVLTSTDVAAWLNGLQALQRLPHDRDFDETRARETWMGRVVLRGVQDSLRLDFYWMRHAPLYDDPERHERVRNFRPHVVVASSAQPRVFFTWGDSVTAAKMLRLW